MSSDDALLGKADQLMRRHRSFVATAKSEAGDAAAADGNEDLPILTEVVASTVEQKPDEDALRLRLDQLLLAQRSAMLGEFERWLDEQLPQVVISAMDGLTDRLVTSITRRARAELLPRLEAIAARTSESVGNGERKDGEQPV